MKSENNVTENTAEAKETQRKYSSYDRRPNDNKRPTNRKNNYRYNKQQRNNRHNDKTATETTTEMTRQTEASGTADLIQKRPVQSTGKSCSQGTCQSPEQKYRQARTQECFQTQDHSVRRIGADRNEHHRF